MAFPRLNLISWYVFMFGGVFTLGSILLGGVDTGWTFYTPYSSTYSNGWVIAMAVGIFINGFSSIFTGLNFIVTIHKLRAPGMTWFRLPLFVWTLYSTSLIFVLATPVLAITLTLVALERGFGIGIFDPRIGGDPLLFQHLFWFYSHPAVYIMVLPAMGVISELIAAFSRNRVFGYNFVVYASLGIAFLGFLVWGHHMFVSGQSVYAGMVFSLLSFLVAIPSAIKVFNWTATLYKGSITFDTPLLYAFGFIALFTLGGMTGLMLASLAVDVHVTATYFVVAHFHYIMVGGAVMAYLGGIHYWFPKMTGRLYPETLARWAAIILFVGFNMTFFPMFLLGYMGMPRRYHVYPEEFQMLNLISTLGTPILGLGYLLPLCYLGWSAFFGRIAGPNPWNATGLEWQTSSRRPRKTIHVSPSSQRNPTPTICFPTQKINRRTPMPPEAAGDALNFPFKEASHQRESALFGMWIFLATEVLFFGGMFAAYTVYRYSHSQAFQEAAHHQEWYLGCLNTFVLLTSGFTMALAVESSRKGNKAWLLRFFAITWVLGALFLGIEGYEYHSKFVEHCIPRHRIPILGERSRLIRVVLLPLFYHDGHPHVPHARRSPAHSWLWRLDAYLGPCAKEAQLL